MVNGYNIKLSLVIYILFNRGGEMSKNSIKAFALGFQILLYIMLGFALAMLCMYFFLIKFTGLLGIALGVISCTGICLSLQVLLNRLPIMEV